jgi:16S rRNA (guanine966-N2)-methyltransferase
VHCNDALEWLARSNAEWDIVFIDPPFDSALGAASLRQLARHEGLRQPGWVYFETRRSQPEYVPEEGYTIFREKNAGDVRYQLLQVQPR